LMSPFLITFFSTLLDDLPMFCTAHRRIRLGLHHRSFPSQICPVFVSPFLGALHSRDRAITCSELISA
jgi:hypothetical protein